MIHPFSAISILSLSLLGNVLSLTTSQGKLRQSTKLLAEQFEGTVVVCTGPTCRRNGGKKNLEMFHEFAPKGVNVESISCVSDCSECGMGPNVELRAKGDDGPFYPIINALKTEDDVKKVLGIE